MAKNVIGMNRPRASFYVAAVVVTALAAMAYTTDDVHAQGNVVASPSPRVAAWTWKDGAGQTRTAGEWSQLLALHRQWLETSGREGTRANLANANLQSLELAGAHLENAVLSSADLSRAHLTAVILSKADLTGVTLTGARFESVMLDGANLKGAFISETSMPGSFLQGADLSYTSVMKSDLSRSHMKGVSLDHAMVIRSSLSSALLDNANLRYAGLLEADLAGATLNGADLEGAVFEPSTQPELRGIANAYHLERATFITSPDALTVLRKGFVDGGYNDQRQRVTYALKHQENELRWTRARSSRCGDPSCRPEQLLGRTCENGACRGKRLNYLYFFLNWAFFDLTVRYGMEPEKALVLLMELWFVFALIYFAFIRFSTKPGLFLVIRRAQRTSESYGRRRWRPRVLRVTPGWRSRLRWVAREWHVFRVAMFFSLLTTFHSGFNELDPGKWIRLITKRDYNLEPERWMRTVAGVQTVLCLFLFAMWVLTQFGHPFET
jgi:uncharacterized protein YjbI with pentapeptide repeats